MIKTKRLKQNCFDSKVLVKLFRKYWQRYNVIWNTIAKKYLFSYYWSFLLNLLKLHSWTLLFFTRNSVSILRNTKRRKELSKFNSQKWNSLFFIVWQCWSIFPEEYNKLLTFILRKQYLQVCNGVHIWQD